MEHNLEQLKQLKHITLSETERGRLRAHGVYLMTSAQPQARIQSLFQRGVHHGLRIALSSFMFIVFVGGTVSAVADNALPGDPLYNFKLNVNEKAKSFFQQSPSQKVATQKDRIETRINEIKTLAESKTLTKEKQAIVEKAIDAHLKDLSNNLSTLSEQTPTEALSVTATLEDTLKTNKETLQNTLTDEGTIKQDAITAIDNTIKKVSDQEVKIIAKELDNITTDVTATMPDTTPSQTSSTPPSTPVEP